MNIKIIENIVKLNIEKIFNNPYQVQIAEDLLSLIKGNNECYHYLMNGYKDGSGGYYPFLLEVCLELKPKHIVELGNREGLGIISIYQAIKQYNDVNFTTIDLIKDLRFVVKKIKEDKKINFLFGDVLNANILDKVKKTGPIDLILFDTIHTEKQLMNEWNLYEPLLNDNALVLIDDLYYDTKYKFFNKLKYDKFVDYKLHGTGFGVLFYTRQK